mmetsp:Transcript_35565/g.77879  ORF Transcript_35565/g.77879 Transcript_35565/m.77879 type:complete len:173 (-) Transcript_35565:204-722(-)
MLCSHRATARTAHFQSTRKAKRLEITMGAEEASPRRVEDVIPGGSWPQLEPLAQKKQHSAPEEVQLGLTQLGEAQRERVSECQRSKALAGAFSEAAPRPSGADASIPALAAQGCLSYLARPAPMAAAPKGPSEERYHRHQAALSTRIRRLAQLQHKSPKILLWSRSAPRSLR